MLGAVMYRVLVLEVDYSLPLRCR